MPRRTVRSPAEFLKSYKTDNTGTYGERAAEFLNAGADELPLAFFDKRYVAKVAFGLSRIPGEDSDQVKNRLSSVLASANRILSRKYRREIWFDKVEGVRATVDDEDLARTVHRRKRRRVKSSAASLDATDKNVDVNKLSADVKREVNKSRKSMKVLNQAIDSMPLLPPTKNNSSE